MKTKIKTIILTLFLASVVSMVLLALPVTTVNAAPADGVYDIAVLEVGLWSEWTVDDFAELSVAPGIEVYTWTTIPDSSLSASGLAPYDVLIVPWHHDYVWLDSSKATSIVAWVNGGNLLIVHNYLFETALSNDPLMAAFGPNYYVDWTGEDGGFPGDSVVIIDPTNPLVATPNTLSADPLCNWMRTVHNSIDSSTAGSAWNWAINSADSGDHWLGYALSGNGAIVINGGDPEFHSTHSADPKNTEARRLIENEIVFEGVIEVHVDIKPGSWPNPINVNSKGVLPVAICGRDDLDVTHIDPATIRLEGESSPADALPLRWSLEDVTLDGFLDLVLLFDTQEVAAALGDVSDGDVLVLTLTGDIKEEFDGAPIKGEDVVVIIKKR